MKISNYTFLLDFDNGEYYLFNSLSNALVEIDRESFDYLRDSKASHSQVEPEVIGEDFWKVLVDKRFVTEDDRDDFLIFKSMIMPTRQQNDFMHLTLVPTMECNFHCFYCFEKEKRKAIMSQKTMDSIVRHITASSGLKKLYLTWFGGEPLMAVPQMELFYDKLHAVYNKDFDSNIITTGYYLTEPVISVLQKIKVSSIQITLDGNRETHNKVKYTAECKDVFSHVLNNIDLLTKVAPEIEVVFRINITKINANEYVELHKYLLERYEGKNISISPGFVKDRNNTHTTSVNKYCLDRNETAKYILDLWHTHKVYTPWIRYPQAFCNECAIRDNQAISFDPEGYAYKCWEMIGIQKFAIGKLNDDGEIINVNRKLLNRQLYGADPLDDIRCSKCSYLPMCEGGCPIQRIQNEFEKGTNDVCTIHKDYLKEFLKIHVKLTKAGYNNH